MKFSATTLGNVYLVELDLRRDHRGFFARSWCQREFEQEGLNSALVQTNVSYNARRGTVRGMHYQAAPHAEDKLIRCTMGAAYDVILDLRPDSPTYLCWEAFELTGRNRRMVYVPKGCAHGFMTLSDETELLYQMSEFYHPEAARGVRWDDPAFGIRWPRLQPIVSQRDQSFSDFRGVAA